MRQNEAMTDQSFMVALLCCKWCLQVAKFQEQYLFSTYEILVDSYGGFLKLNLKLNKMHIEESVLCHGAQIQMRESVCPPFDALLRHINLARRPSNITMHHASIDHRSSGDCIGGIGIGRCTMISNLHPVLLLLLTSPKGDWQLPH